MSQDEFTKLFNYMVKRFDEAAATSAAEFAEIRSGMDDIRNTLDSLHAKADIDDTERLVLGHQVERHDTWIEKAAPAIGVSYDRAV